MHSLILVTADFFSECSNACYKFQEHYCLVDVVRHDAFVCNPLNTTPRRILAVLQCAHTSNIWNEDPCPADS